MPFPKLLPSQSRIAVLLATFIIMIMLCIALSSHFAYASGIDSSLPKDYSQEGLVGSHIFDEETDIEIRQAPYEADFFGADRGIIGRVDTGSQYVELLNNVPQRKEIVPGGPTVYFLVQNITLLENAPRDQPEELDAAHPRPHLRRDGPAIIYISLNTCQQPADPTDVAGSKGAPSQPQLYISQSPLNTLPGPGQSADTQMQVPVVGGFANSTLSTSGPVYIGISAPNTTTFTQGNYLVEIAASVNASFHSQFPRDFTLHLVDSDTASALLITDDFIDTTSGDLFDESMNLDPLFSIFVVNANKTIINGVQNSYCGLNAYADIAGIPGGTHSDNVEKGMTNLTGSSHSKQQFHVQGLNGSSTYYGILAVAGNSTKSGAGVVGGGGMVMRGTMQFSTKADGNCVLIYNLSFCDSVAYTVPGNLNNFPNATILGQWYDNQTQSAYTQFQNTLAQIPCDIEPEGAYSLVKNCADCAAAYRSWVCSVMIPRCVDFSSPDNDSLRRRNIFAAFPNGTMLDSSLLSPIYNVSSMNSSRNPNIDTFVQPGPYKELLPCEDLCYGIVQSCPASMGFSCPVPSMPAFSSSYGRRLPSQNLTCNYPGAMRDAQSVGSIKIIGYSGVITSFMALIFIIM